MVRLYINGEEVELSEKSVALYFQINDIAELKNRQSDYSNQFEILKTGANMRVLGFPDISDGATKPYEKLQATLKIGDNELHGFCIIDEGTELTYAVTFYKGNLQFFEEIEDKSLRSLDMSDYDHTWDYATVLNSHDETTGIIYPLIDWGYDNDVMTNAAATVNPKYLHPCIYFKDVWDRIFEEYNLNYDGNIFDEDIFTKMLVTLSINPDDSIAERLKVIAENYVIRLVSLGQQELLEFPYESKDDYNLLQYRNVFTGSTYQQVNCYKSIYAGDYSIKLRLEFGQIYPYVGDSLTLNLVKITGLDLSTAVIIGTTTYTHVAGDQLIQEIELDGTYTLSTGQYLYAYISLTGMSVNILEEELNIYEIALSNLEYNNAFPVAMNLPDMTIKEFIKNFMQMTGQVIQYDQYTRTLYFKDFREIIQNKPAAYDWSEKVSDIVTSFKVGDYAQKNYMTYNNDDNVNENRGRGEFFITDEKLDFSKELFSLKYSATNKTTKLINKEVSNIPVNKDVVGFIDKQNDWRERVLLMRFENFACLYDDGVYGSPITINNNLPMAYFMYNGDGLGFEYLIPTYYTELTQILDRAKFVTCKAYLTAQDIATLDHFRPVYLRQTGQYYYINRVNEWIDGELCDVELIRL